LIARLLPVFTFNPRSRPVADIHIVRQHSLGLPAARKIACRWADQAEEGLQMKCTYEEGKLADQVCFERAGAQGTLDVTASQFELRAKLGFLLGAFKGRIEAEITKNLDAMLAEAATAQTAGNTSGKAASKPTNKGSAKATGKVADKVADKVPAKKAVKK
jgi:putative polyhydroxyalkanoate system protein